MLTADRRTIIVGVNPAHPAALATKSRPDARSHRKNRAAATVLTSLAVAPTRLSVVRHQRSSVAEPYLTPALVPLPGRRHGVKQGQNAVRPTSPLGLHQLDGRHGREATVEGASRQVIAQYTGRVGRPPEPLARVRQRQAGVEPTTGTHGVSGAGPSTRQLCIRRRGRLRVAVGPIGTVTAQTRQAIVGLTNTGHRPRRTRLTPD